MPEYTEINETQTFDISDVEVFSVGKWNGDEYTEKDLDDMVESHVELSQKIKPYLKLGHDNKQAMLQRDGMPAAGWVTNLKRVGTKLVADFKSVPKKIKELIEKKAYGRFSSELYWDLKVDEKKYRRVLKAVALLGADTPAVQDLDDFISLYNENKLNYEEIKNYHIIEDNNMAEEKIYEDLRTQVKEYEIKIADQDKDIVSHKETIVDLEGQLKTLTEDIEKKDLEQKEKDIKLFIDTQVSAKKILPFQVEKYTELAKKDFEAVQELVKDMPELIDLKETSKHSEKPKEFTTMNENERDDFKVEKAYAMVAENEGMEYKDALALVEKELEGE